MYECLLFIVMCALDMLLIKATCLLNCSRYRSKRDEISAEEKDIFRWEGVEPFHPFVFTTSFGIGT